MSNMFEQTTAQIIGAIKAGAGEYRMPWHKDGVPGAQPTPSRAARIAASTRCCSRRRPRAPPTRPPAGRTIGNGRSATPRSVKAGAQRSSCD